MGVESGSSRLGVLVLAAILLLGGVKTADAEGEAPSLELSGGYAFLRDQSDESTNLPVGWYFSISKTLTDSLGVVADVGGSYKSEAGIDINEHAFLAGARYSFRGERFTPYVEALGGEVRRGSNLGDPIWDFAVQGGVGLGFKVNEDASLRAGVDFRNIFGDASSQQFRIVVGVTFGLGGRRESAPSPPPPPGPAAAPQQFSPPTPRPVPPQPAPPPAPEPTPAPERARPPEAPLVRPPAPAPPPSDAFARGRDLLRGSRYSEASDAFREHLRLHADGFTIAVGFYCEASNLAQIVQGSDTEQVFLLRGRRQARICYGVYWGLFASRQEAQQALASLPLGLRAGGETPIPVSRLLR